MQLNGCKTFDCFASVYHKTAKGMRRLTACLCGVVCVPSVSQKRTKPILISGLVAQQTF